MSAQAALILMLATPLTPLLLALAMMARPDAARLQLAAPFAALPALAVSALLPAGTVATLPWLLEGGTLGLDGVGRLFLFCAAALWMACAVYARPSLPTAGRTRFFVYFLLTMSGNLGLILAGDMLTFYLFFTVMSLSAYGLIAHDRSTAARYAAGVYITLVIIGDLMLYAALVLTALETGGSLLFEAVREAVASSVRADTILLLIVLGLGVKVGVLGLHVSLPLIYSSAPTAGAAVLAGAVINAGLLGWLRALPLGAAELAGWGRALAIAGAAAVFYGALIGTAERRPKAVLAYSSISQMGIMTLALGGGLLAPAAASQLVLAVAVYAIHHAFAKSALFLGAGFARRATSGGWRRLGCAGLLLPALALAGAPFTSGMLVKEWLKEIFAASAPGTGWLVALLPWTAVATTLVVARFLWLAWPRRSARARAPSVAAAIAWLAILVLVALAVWALPGTSRPTPTPAAIWSAAWPVLLGVLLAATAMRHLHAPRLPRGDVLVIGTLLTRWLLRGWRLLSLRWTPAARDRLLARARAVRRHPLWLTSLARAEQSIGHWAVSGTLFVALILAFAAGTLLLD